MRKAVLARGDRRVRQRAGAKPGSCGLIASSWVGNDSTDYILAAHLSEDGPACHSKQHDPSLESADVRAAIRAAGA